MASRHPTGSWAALNYEAIQMVVRMMALATADIKAQWSTESDELTLEMLTREKFWDDLIDTDGDSELTQQLNAKFLPIVQQALQAAFAPPEKGETE